ncbi:MAG TPA: TraB/GumN family protein [Methylophilaceae bacterium]|nr:TraB/GumN family protein [Methylophilaceae bacterium]
MNNKYIVWLKKAAALLLLSSTMFSHATEKGVFWKVVSPSGETSYLFGTMHTDDSRITDFSSNVIDAIKNVDVFVMETEPNSNPKHFLLSVGTLESSLTEEELDKVKDLADFHVMRIEQALKMKPWLLAFVFSQSKPQTPFAQDNLLMRSAEDFGKPVNGLETSEEHFSVIDSFTQEEQLTMLRTALKLTQEQKERDFEKLIDTYLVGDTDGLLRFDAEMTGAQLPQALWDKIRVKLLDERNVLMVTRVLHLLENQSVFIAVGAAHLAGEDGLITALKKAGFQLSPMPE